MGAISLFQRGMRERAPYAMRDIRIGLAAALGRSKFAASPLDREPRSLIGCDTEPVEVVIGTRAQLLKKVEAMGARPRT